MRPSQLILTIATLVASAAAGCGRSTASSPPPNSPPPPAAVTVTVPPAVSLNPTSLAFGNQAINTTSAPRTVTLTNTGTAPYLFDFLQISGSPDFAQTNNCPLTIAAGTNCTFSVTFTPTNVGERMASLVFENLNPFVTMTGTGTEMTTNPTPAIITISPSSTKFGGPAFTLTVVGSNFVSSSVVRWNGSDRPTAFVNSTQVTTQIPAGDIAATGTAAITVFNPPPGGGTSNSLTFRIATGVRPISLAVAPDPSGKFGKFAYVANAGSNNISMFTIDAATGALTSAGTIAAGTGPGSVAVDPSGKFVYAANTGSNNVSMYTVNAASGALTSTGTVAVAVNPWSVTVHPSGKFAYVANAGSNNISMFTIDAATGALTSTGTVAAGTRPDSVAVDPSGKFAYVANSISADVSMYTIDAITGALTSTGPVAAGTAVSVTVHPSGKFAYVANCGDVVSISDLSRYTIDDATGTLTSLGRIDTSTCPISVAVHPSGKFAYVANAGDIEGFRFSGGVSMYTINGSTGELTSIGTIDAGLFPMSVAIDPSGKFAYVTNWGSNNISMYSVNATTGTLTLIGTVGT